MTKNKKKRDNDLYNGDRKITSEESHTLMSHWSLVYGANVNFMRQIPSLYDGLKLVERRILYTMLLLKLRPSASTMKSARIVGEVMGTLHPHGDSSIYDVLVRLTQPYNTYIPLATSDGNFGTIYNPGASAMRYTETKLTKFAWECFFEDFDINNVFTRDSFDGKMEEPEYVPSKYPIGLILGTFGIGNGIRVDIPQFNPSDILKLSIERLTHPEKEPKLIYPDSATGCDIVDNGTFEDIFHTGKGTIVYRGHIEVDYNDHSIYIYNPPPKVYLDTVKKKITELRTKGAIKGIVDMTDTIYDGREAYQYMFKKEIDLEEVRRIIFKNTGMENSLPCNILYLDDYKEFSYGIYRYVDEWLDIRREYKQILFTKNLTKVFEQIHTLDTILMIFEGDNGKKAIEYISSTTTEKSIKYLMDKFDISSLQARTIADMRISAFSKDSIRSFKDRLPVLHKERKRLQKYLNDSVLIDEIILAELQDGLAKYGEGRRSKIIKLDGGEIIPNTLHKVVTTMDGYIKKLQDTTSSIGSIREGDIPTDIIGISNREDLLIIDSAGHLHKIPVSKIQNNDLESVGLPASDYVKLKGRVCGFLPKPSEDFIKENPNASLVLLSKNGMIKRTNISEYVNMKSSVIIMKLDDGDTIVNFKFTNSDEDDLLLYTNNGMGIRYSSLEVKDTGRTSKGVEGIKFIEDDDYAIGLDVIQPNHKYILCVTDKGRVKKCELSHFRSMQRKNKPLRLVTLDDGEYINTIKGIKGKERFAVFMKNDTIEICAKDIPVMARLAKANKMIPVRRGDHIVNVKKIEK